jgi:hypothetical protein
VAVQESAPLVGKVSSDACGSREVFFVLRLEYWTTKQHVNLTSGRPANSTTLARSDNQEMTNSRSLRFLPSPQIGSTSPLRSSAKSKPRRLGRATSSHWQARFRRPELCLQVSSIFSARRRKLTDYRRYGLRCRAFHFPLRNLRRESDVQSVAKFESTTAFITEPNRKTSLSKAFPLFFPSKPIRNSGTRSDQLRLRM